MNQLRGEHMTRIETFVAAAFAFAVTMLVISVDSIPNTFVEFLDAVKQIPAFAASFAIITWIWHEHATWCKKYGLEDTKSVFLSCVLVFLVLIYIYPLRLMMQGLFAFVSQGYLPFDLGFEAFWQVRFLFGFYAIGFLCLSVTFAALFRHVCRNKELLDLSDSEFHDAKVEVVVWNGVGCVCILALICSLVLPPHLIGYSGFSYFLLFPLNFIVRRKHSISIPRTTSQQD